MKNKKMKFCLYSVLLLILIVGTFVFSATDAMASGTTIARGVTTRIDIHGQCRDVINNHATLNIWVPTLTSAEWNSFILHRPVHAGVVTCPAPPPPPPINEITMTCLFNGCRSWGRRCVPGSCPAGYTDMGVSCRVTHVGTSGFCLHGDPWEEGDCSRLCRR